MIKTPKKISKKYYRSTITDKDAVWTGYEPLSHQAENERLKPYGMVMGYFSNASFIELRINDLGHF